MANEIVNDQNQLFGRIGCSIENFRKLGADSQTKSAIESRLERLNQNWNKFEENYAVLRSTKLTDEIRKDVYFTNDPFSTAEEEYLQAKSYFAGLLSELENPPQLLGSRRSSIGPSRSKPLPKINPPKFNGSYNEWVSFRDLFTSLVGDNEEISAVEKLQYLKMSVGGDAAKLIANIPVTDDNYARTWAKLEARYQNKRALINAQLDIFFSVKPIQRKCARDLENLRSTAAQVLEALEALEGPVWEWDFSLVYFLCRLLDSDTHEAWDHLLRGQTELPTYAELDSFLEGRIRALETLDGRSSASRSQTSMPSRPSRQSAPRTSQVFASSVASCSCCGASHYIAACPVYRAKTSQQSRELVIAKRLCFNCLGPHRVSICKTSKRCYTCNQQHHSSLHYSDSSSSGSASAISAQASGTTSSTVQAPSNRVAIPFPETGANASRQSRPDDGSGSAASHHATIISPPSSSSQSLLATAFVTVLSPEGMTVKARALLDQGSKLSFVSEAIVQTLRLPRRQPSIALFGIGAQQQTVTRGSVLLQFGGRLDPKTEFSTEAHVLKRVTGSIPAAPVHVDRCTHLCGLDLADPSFATPGGV